MRLACNGACLFELLADSPLSCGVRGHIPRVYPQLLVPVPALGHEDREVEAVAFTGRPYRQQRDHQRISSFEAAADQRGEPPARRTPEVKRLALRPTRERRDLRC